MTVLLLLLAALTAMAGASFDSSPTPVAVARGLPWLEMDRIAHDPAAFTQGLLMDDQGRLFESTGGWGTSGVRELDPADGRVLRSQALPDAWFGEGLALVDDELVQLTWKAGQALRWDVETLDLVATQAYQGEGWGLCDDGERLVMSDGSARLTFRDRASFEIIGSVDVTLEGQPLAELNELECVDEVVWANVWHEDRIVRIDPANGRVTGWLDLSGLLVPHPAETDPEAVLNGIAWDATAGTMWVTGKRWPAMVELRLLEPEERPD